MATTGIVTNDFAQILSDFSRTLSYNVSTRVTDPLTGAESDTFAASTNVDAVFYLKEQRYLFDKSGVVEVGDAYILVPTTTTIKRYDRFTIGGETFYIDNIIHRYVLNVAMLDLGICFKVV